MKIGATHIVIGAGLLLLIGGIVIVVASESNNVERAGLADRAVEIGDIGSVDASLEGKVVHAVGTARTDETLMDSAYGVSEQALVLDRRVEYYQKCQKQKSSYIIHHSNCDTDGEVYTSIPVYVDMWCDAPVNSSIFTNSSLRSVNYVLKTVRSGRTASNTITFGAYKLSKELATYMGGSCETAVGMEEWQKRKVGMDVMKMAAVKKGWKVDEKYYGDWVHVSKNTVYLGRDERIAQIGDVRIKFSSVKPEATVSVLGVVRGGTIVPVETDDEYYIGMKEGEHAASEMSGKTEERASLWLLRVCGLLLLFLGVRIMYRSIVEWVEAKIGTTGLSWYSENTACLVIAVAVWLMTTCVVWIPVRPVTSILTIVFIPIAIVAFAHVGRRNTIKAIRDGSLYGGLMVGQKKLDNN